MAAVGHDDDDDDDDDVMIVLQTIIFQRCYFFFASTIFCHVECSEVYYLEVEYFALIISYRLATIEGVSRHLVNI